MTPSTMQDLINLQGTDQAQIDTDNTKITADQATLKADTATLGTDQGTQVTDTANFDTALGQTGPVIGLNPDGVTGTVYAAAGAVIPANTPIPLASSVAIPAPPQPPAVPPGS